MATVNQQIDALLKRTKNPAIKDRWYVYGADGRLIAGDLFYKTALGALRKVFPGVHVYSKGVSGGGTVSYAIDQEPRHVFVSRDPDFDLRRKAASNPARKSRKVTLVAATRNPTRADDVPGDFSQSSARVYGRAWTDAKNASVKDVGNDAIVRLTFPDGEWLQMVFDSRAGALKCLKRLGFA